MTLEPLPPPQPPLPVESVVRVPPRLRRCWAKSEILAWVVILLAIGTILALPLLPHRAPAPGASAGPSGPGVQMLMTARYVVGVHSILPLEKLGQVQAYLQSIDKEAKTPSDKLRAAIVRGEVAGKAAALDELTRLRGLYPTLAPDIDTVEQVYSGETSRSSPALTNFQRRHGWFADLAESRGKPAADPQRAATIWAARRTAATIGALVLVVLVASIAGVALLITGLIFYFSKRLRPAFDRTVPPSADRRRLVQGFAFYLGIMGFVSLAIKVVFLLVPGTVNLAIWASIIMLPAAFAAGFSWPLLRRQPWSDFRMAMGLHTGRGVFRELGCGLVGYVAGLPIVGFGLLVTLGLMKFTSTTPSHPIVFDMTPDISRLLLLLVLASVWAPITEELMFRGALFAHLRERFGFWISALLVAFVFAIIHPQGWVAAPVLASLAFVFAGIREWRGSILGCMMAHAINNGLLLIVLFLVIS